MHYNVYLSEQLMHEQQRAVQRSLARAALVAEAQRQHRNRSCIHWLRARLSLRRHIHTPAAQPV